MVSGRRQQRNISDKIGEGFDGSSWLDFQDTQDRRLIGENFLDEIT